ncbi:hypothetical protein HaLaN_18138 [Haematococcus lacustris]|uniref:Uncharacterized protein n=1 Tax=Haematococcus lacustris TaxID=44745 RepID=A0A699ZIK8_HAELA|nr:hypothetical protein HaLaN_18138 [Haematococcus lacustris]
MHATSTLATCGTLAGHAKPLKTDPSYDPSAMRLHGQLNRTEVRLGLGGSMEGEQQRHVKHRGASSWPCTHALNLANATSLARHLLGRAEPGGSGVVRFSSASPRVHLIPGSSEQRGTDLDAAFRGEGHFSRPTRVLLPEAAPPQGCTDLLSLLPDALATQQLPPTCPGPGPGPETATPPSPSPAPPATAALHGKGAAAEAQVLEGPGGHQSMLRLSVAAGPNKAGAAEVLPGGRTLTLATLDLGPVWRHALAHSRQQSGPTGGEQQEQGQQGRGQGADADYGESHGGRGASGAEGGCPPRPCQPSPPLPDLTRPQPLAPATTGAACIHGRSMCGRSAPL